jgi:hypothetical protein
MEADAISGDPAGIILKKPDPVWNSSLAKIYAQDNDEIDEN